jgi:hypothetical protein
MTSSSLHNHTDTNGFNASCLMFVFSDKAEDYILLGEHLAAQSQNTVSRQRPKEIMGLLLPFYSQ